MPRIPFWIALLCPRLWRRVWWRERGAGVAGGQGFASGDLDRDASSVRRFVERGFEMLVSQSYSKNLGLYSERVGALNAVLATPAVASRVKSQLKRLARAMYSNPPVHGARIVAAVVGDPQLFGEWKGEMEMMAGRILKVRRELYQFLADKDRGGKDWSFVKKQIGMFSFTGLTPPQVREGQSGRSCCGLFCFDAVLRVGR